LEHVPWIARHLRSGVGKVEGRQRPVKLPWAATGSTLAGDGAGIVGSTTGNNYYVRILSTLNRELMKPSASVALHRHSNSLVDILPPEADSSISLLGASEKPDTSYQVRGPGSLAWQLPGRLPCTPDGGRRLAGCRRPQQHVCALSWEGTPSQDAQRYRSSSEAVRLLEAVGAFRLFGA
jgi:Proteasomal ATPase OB C-terminal domain